MYYVYLLESEAEPAVGTLLSSDLKQRFDDHNVREVFTHGQIQAVAPHHLCRIFQSIQG